MRVIQISIATLLLAGVVTPAVADSDWQSWPTGHKFQFAAGYFLPDLDTTVRITDVDGVVGTAISFEENLGVEDNKSTFLLFAKWRFLKRHSVNLAHFELQRDATTEASVLISVGDQIFDNDVPIQTFLDIAASELFYSYSLLLSERMDFFLGVGISFQKLELGLQGTASSPNPGEIIDSRLASSAPLPTLNVGFDYAFTDKWLFRSKLGWLAVEAELGADENLSGEIINAVAGIEWRAFENVGFFANYQLFDLATNVQDDGTTFDVDYQYSGPVIGISVNF